MIKGITDSSSLAKSLDIVTDVSASLDSSKFTEVLSK